MSAINLLHADTYTSALAMAANARGDLFFAIVVDPPGNDNQYCVIKRQSVTGEVKELKRLYSRDSRRWIHENTSSTRDDDGKYGAVGIAITGRTVWLALSMRIDGKQVVWSPIPYPELAA